MQHAVGAPLPPPQGPGNGPAGWTHQAQHPGHPGPPGPPPPCGTAGPGPGLDRARPAPRPRARLPGDHRARPAAARWSRPAARATRRARHGHGDARRPPDRSGGRGQDHRGQAVGQPPPGPHRARQPRRRPRMGLLRLRRPAGRVERPLGGPVPAGPPHLWLRRPQFPGQRHLLHPRRRGVPRPPGRRPRRLEAPCGPGTAARGAPPRPGDRAGAQRRPQRQPCGCRTRRSPGSTAGWRAGTARGCRSSTTRPTTWRPRPASSTTYSPAP